MRALKISWCLILNLILMPVYLSLFLLAFFVALTPLSPARTARRNLRERLQVSRIGSLGLSALSLFNYGLAVMELLVLSPLGAVVRLNEDEYWAFLDRVVGAYGLRESGRGLVFIGGHYAAIEEAGGVMTSYWLRFRNQGVTVLAKPASFQWGTALMDAYRRYRQLNVIWTGRSGKMWAAMRERLENGGSLGLVVDQKASVGGLFATFFGAWASFPYRGIGLSQALAVPCVANNVRRWVPGIFVIEYALMPPAESPEGLELSGVVNRQEYEQAIALGTFPYVPSILHEHSEKNLGDDPDGSKARTRYLMSHFVGWLEALIRKSPYQWCWDYRKWSRRPAGEAS